MQNKVDGIVSRVPADDSKCRRCTLHAAKRLTRGCTFHFLCPFYCWLFLVLFSLFEFFRPFRPFQSEKNRPKSISGRCEPTYLSARRGLFIELKGFFTPFSLLFFSAFQHLFMKKKEARSETFRCLLNALVQPPTWRPSTPGGKITRKIQSNENNSVLFERTYLVTSWKIDQANDSSTRFQALPFL